MPWLLNEDEALKNKLLGLTVEDSNAPQTGRPVAVRFRLPDTELADVTFPMVVIDHAGISRDTEREHRGSGRLPYAPEGKARWEEYGERSKSPYKFDEFPIPYNIDYVVTSYARKARHDMSLTLQLASVTRLPSRFGYLEIPQDGTVRRLDLLAGPEPDHAKDQDGKRVFRQVYRIRVSSELEPSKVDEFIRVTSVNTNLKYALDKYDASISIPA